MYNLICILLISDVENDLRCCESFGFVHWNSSTGALYHWHFDVF